ncbi:uncharacterized protein [Ptychodera flava]|uniref:uncharacterized protein n=1 Tax=Ptychodera flava TaxID=63121 RepID=UPI00396A6EA4
MVTDACEKRASYFGKIIVIFCLSPEKTIFFTMSKRRNKVDDMISMNSSGSKATLGRLWCGKDSLLSNSAKRWLFAKLIVVFFVPVGLLLVIMSMAVWQIALEKDNIHHMESQFSNAMLFKDVIAFLQHERCEFTKSNMLNYQHATLESTSLVYRCANVSDIDFPLSSQTLTIDGETFTSREGLREYIYAKAIELNDNSSNSTSVLVYSKAILNLTKQIIEVIKLGKSGSIWQPLMSYLMLIKTQENLEMEKLIGALYFADGTFPSRSFFLLYCKSLSVADMTFIAAKRYSFHFMDIESDCFADAYCPEIVSVTRKEIRVEYLESGNYNITMTEGLEYLNELSIIGDKINQLISSVELLCVEILADLRTSATNNITLDVFALLISIIIVPLTLRTIVNIVRQLQKSVENIAGQTSLLTNEKRKADSLLTQMLPPQVAEDLKSKKPVKAEIYDSATVLFTDVVDFTKYTTMMEPVDVVRMLNSLYSCFDARIKLYDVYKVETIGEVYMCVSGLPTRNGSRHTGEIASLSLHLQRSMSEISIPGHSDIKLKLRAGINTGPVVAGVVGIATPRYCLFGDTVNTASRMESNCLPGKIQISQQTGRCLTELGGFVVVPRGQILVKGKGKMMTYWLVGRRQLSNGTFSRTESVAVGLGK